MNIPKDLKDEIWDYCRLNDIPNVDSFTLKLLKQGFTVEKFGATPQTKEVIVEKIVEKEVEVEKIVEKKVPVEKIIEKEIYITDNEEVNKLSNKVSQLNEDNNVLKKELDDKKTEISNLLSRVNELEVEIKKEKEKKRGDIYGEY